MDKEMKRLIKKYQRDLTVIKCYEWNCSCGSNGYEPSRIEAKVRLAQHLMCNHPVK